jgi:hypothetical protein
MEDCMYIKKEDFNYFEGLYKSLDEAKRKKFLDALLKAGVKRSGGDISKIQVVGDEIFDERGIEPGEFIARTMIKKAYKAAKEE